ncbi:sterigmatocystin 8-o-methyltransferase [Colletotrichum kahawae]|uniref:Sterigmatocystin 8-o-methyltransferase n=1 Tax=Colletotrichum kahawae TaxID=34407 RepID=A0AAD9Y0J0_COLKA|nr:sterigmatocystin 8-o-methyltransferase [Colletotrichum kahawae]
MPATNGTNGTNGSNGTNGTKDAPVVDPSIATSPNDLAAVPGLLKELNAGIGSLSTGGQEARHELLLKARSIVQALEAPRETMIKHCWAQTGSIAGVNFGVDSGLWKLMAKNGDRPQNVTELAEALGVDPALLSRLMSHLGAMGYIKETGLHEYSRKRGFKNPTDAKDTPMMYAYNTNKDMFSWQQDLGYDTHFNHHMSGYRQGRNPWMAPGFFPVKERLIEGADNNAEATFLVDIGGSIGHDLAEFHHYHPDAPGKLILQDLPVVIGQIQELTPAITPMGHDFLTEQPVKGARAYYMHSCLHDWPDDVCEKILAQIKAAMKPGYSKLLINENVIPSTGAWWETSALDMVMLTLFCSKERTEGDWYNLLEKIAGLKIVKIWGGGKGVESLIEVELP